MSYYENTKSAWFSIEAKCVLLCEYSIILADVKARDAYDVHVLKKLGATLSANLQAHLEDTIIANEIDSDAILDRIERIDVNHCRLELKPILPPDAYASLEAAGFEPLRSALTELYEPWL